MGCKGVVLKKTFSKIGLPAGSLVYVGSSAEQPGYAHLYQLSQDEIKESNLQYSDLGDIPNPSQGQKFWLNLFGLRDIISLKSLNLFFSIPDLWMEDFLNTGHMPKFDAEDSEGMLILKMLSLSSRSKMQEEHLGVYFNERTVICFQEREGDVFDSIRKRMMHKNSKIRKEDALFLTYAIVDNVMDHYFNVMESYESKLQFLEDSLHLMSSDKASKKLIRIKRKLVQLNRYATRNKELVYQMIRSDLFQENLLQKHLLDLKDHVDDIFDLSKSLLSRVTDLQSLAGQLSDQRTNRMLRILTVVSAIFMPLSLIAGIYGMNFKIMPELELSWGYPAALGLMGVLAAILLIFFNSRGWFK